MKEIVYRLISQVPVILLGCFQIERKISKTIKEKRITTVILHLNPIFNNKKSPILFFCADY
jgi:hypothetical protein